MSTFTEELKRHAEIERREMAQLKKELKYRNMSQEESLVRSGLAGMILGLIGIFGTVCLIAVVLQLIGE